MFEHMLLPGPLHALRGKGFDLNSGEGSFQWSAALQGLCLLLLGARINLGGDASISGQRGSPASSLDYALTKGTSWLRDLFGSDSRGNLLAQRLIKRSNTECKKGGEVKLALNQEFLSRSNVRIYLNGKRIDSEEKLLEIERAILSGWRPKAKPRRQDKPEAQGPSVSWSEILREGLAQETARMLCHLDISSPAQTKHILQKIYKNPSFSGIAGAPLPLVAELDQSLKGSARLGYGDARLLKSHLSPDEPIRIAVPGSSAGPISILQYLKLKMGYNIEILYTFPHAIDVTHHLFEKRFSALPDALVLGIAPAGTLLAHRPRLEYSALMLMPGFSHRVVAPCGGDRHYNGEYYFLRDDPSTSSFYFDDLVRRGDLSSKLSPVRHGEPDQVADILKNGDEAVRAILFFPHHILNDKLNDCVVLPEERDQSHIREAVLFVHDKIAADKNLALCMDIAVRNAWLELRDNAALRQEISESLLQDQGYATFMYRSCGIGNMRRESTSALEDLGASF
ncbi:MAG: hypothetical protein DCC75_10145 [Proteobacteria bacterium]|nr:MAG: hypothetical protein DCC75_10145 [Pseudomonadota bacterium]